MHSVGNQHLSEWWCNRCIHQLTNDSVKKDKLRFTPESVGSLSFVFPLYGTFNSLQSTPTYMHPWSTSLPLPSETDGFTPATFTPCTLFGLLAFHSNLLFLFLPREDHKHKPLDPSYFATGFSRHHAKWRFAHVNEFCTVIAPSVCVDHASLPPLCANVYLVTLSSLSSTNKSERQTGEQINEVFHPKSALEWANKQRLNCHSTSKLLFLYSPSPFLHWSCWFLEDSATGMSSGCFLWYGWEGGDYVARTGSLVAVSLYQTWTHTHHEAVHRLLLPPVIPTISNHMFKKRKCKAVVSFWSGVNLKRIKSLGNKLTGWWNSQAPAHVESTSCTNFPLRGLRAKFQISHPLDIERGLNRKETCFENGNGLEESALENSSTSHLESLACRCLHLDTY